MMRTKIIDKTTRDKTTQKLTFAEFIQVKPDEGLWELHDGVVVEIAQPKGKHETVISRLNGDLTLEFKRLGLPYGIPTSALVKSAFTHSAYRPDLLILNETNLINEPFWEEESTVTFKESIALVVEVVSTNWRDDYYKKYGEYSAIGISEYWIADYLGLGGKEFTGNPKQPTLTIFLLDDESDYVKYTYRGNELVKSRLFPDLNLTANYILGLS
mgnify:FL=1